MILIDNYDSFTYNIVQYLKELGVSPQIFKNDEISVEEIKKLNFSSVIISPGPKGPLEAGISLEVIKEFYKTKKILGVCLGHQCIAHCFGAKVVKAKEPVHGKVSKIYFEADALFEGLEQGFEATRYHSLVVDEVTLPDCLKTLAYASSITPHPGPRPSRGEGESEINFYKYFVPCAFPLMALKHKKYPLYGVQFHPEAILTQGGRILIKNFLQMDCNQLLSR